MMQIDFCLLPVMIIGYALIFAAMGASRYPLRDCRAKRVAMRALFPVSCRTAADAYAGHGLHSVHEAPKLIDWAVETGRAASARSSFIGSAEVAPRYRRNKPALRPIFAAITFAYHYLRPLMLQRHSCHTLVSVRPRHAAVDFWRVRSEVQEHPAQLARRAKS
jgi:hypothetical protein